MLTKPAIVYIVVDCDYGVQLDRLPSDEPVWIVDTPANRAAAEESRIVRPAGVHGNGVTLFTSTASSAEESVIHQLDTIDLHHGFHSADPPYAGFHIIGTEPTARLVAGLAEYGLTEIAIAESGFRASKPD